MSKIAIFEHLKSCSEAAKNFTGKLVGEVVQAVAAAIEELEQKVYKHGDTVSIPDGGTGGKSAEEALANLGAAPLGHTHDSAEHTHFIRQLTADDDLDNITENGVYYYNSDSVPQKVPYSNAAIVEVVGDTSENSRKIQRVTRWGTTGYCSIRNLYNGNWGEWKEFSTTDHKHTASEVGAAESSHTHSATQINSDVLSVTRGGTGVESLADLRSAMGTGYIRQLTSSDNLDNIVENGVYFYNSETVPTKVPYSNAAIVEVLGSNSDTTQKIQRVTRWGASGYCSTRNLSGGKWGDWKENATTAHMCGGLVNVNVSAANTVTMRSVNFPRTLAGTPAVTVTPNTNTPQAVTGCGVRNETSDGFELYVIRPAAASTDVNYVAVVK